MMNELKCPNCGQVFKIDESGYSALLQQVRDKEFDKAVQREQKHFEEQLKLERDKASQMQRNAEQTIRHTLEEEIQTLKQQLSEEKIMHSASLSAAETEKKSAVVAAQQIMQEKQTLLERQLLEAEHNKS